MYRPSDSHYTSWTSRSGSHQPPPYYPSTTPGPMPAAPHLRTVSLPHPNSAPYHGSATPSYASFVGPSNILALNPLLSWTGAPPLYYNVTRDVQCIQLRPGSSPEWLHAPAINPACTLLVLKIPSLPLWSTIEVRNSHGVSAYDVLVRIRDVLNRSVSPSEMHDMGARRFDFLGPNVFFAGLSRSMDGLDRWEVRFVPRA